MSYPPYGNEPPPGGYPQQPGGYPPSGGYPQQPPGEYPQQGGYPQQQPGYPQQGGYPQPGYGQPQPGQPQPGYPQQPGGYPADYTQLQPGYPQPGYPQAGGYPQDYTQLQPGYPQAAYNPYGAPQAGGQLAGWGARVGAVIIDGLLVLPAYIVVIIGNAIGNAAGTLLALVGVVGMIAIGLWNLNRQGTTGSSVGKKTVGIKIVGQQTGQPIGFGMSILRQLVHFVDSLICGLGYLWPLWDDKHQTFADKIMDTLSVRITEQG